MSYLKYLLFIFSLLFVSCSSINQEKQETKTYIKNIDFFTQAPFETKENWAYNQESCEEASILLYTSFLGGKKYDKLSFDEELKKMVNFQIKKYSKEKDLTKFELKDFINDYFKNLQAKVALNLDKIKITWFLQDNKPIIIGINAKDIENPYYNYTRYHTLLIIGETKEDYIVKDIGTKHGNDWYYPKTEILKAIKNAGMWGIIIEKVSANTVNNDNIKSNPNYNYSTFQSKNYYDDLILDEKCCLNLDLPNNIGAGIIAHHLVVGTYFDNYFRLLKQNKQNINTFIIVGTNHFNFDDEIYTTNKDYKTPFGILEINKNLQKNINSLNINNELLFNEHSIHSIVGFIKKYYPDSKILPIIINENVSKEKLDNLKNEVLGNYDKSNFFYLQSTDFTHFQPQYLTDFYDLYSKNILDDFDKTRIDKMMIDSRKVQYFTFELLENLGLKKHYNLINSSSNNYLGVENFLNTSHFFSYFGAGENQIKSNQVSLLFTGDMILNYDKPSSGKIQENGKNEFVSYPFDKIDSFEETFFRGYDEIITNIEGNFDDKTYERDIKIDLFISNLMIIG